MRFICFQVTNKHVLPVYLRVVESSYFNSSDKVKLLSRNARKLLKSHLIGTWGWQKHVSLFKWLSACRVSFLEFGTEQISIQRTKISLSHTWKKNTVWWVPLLCWQTLKLADQVEELFVKHFAQDDKRKAMKYLKPTQREESHAVTFFIGKIFVIVAADHMLEGKKVNWAMALHLIVWIKQDCSLAALWLCSSDMSSWHISLECTDLIPM